MSSEPLAIELAAAALPSDVAIRVRGLSKCYRIFDRPEDRLKQSIFPKFQRMAGIRPRQYHRDFWALRDVSFDVSKGETVGIVGRNGSGKSTLLHLVVGTHAVTEGTVEVNGRITALLELGSGFNPLFTGRENAYMNAAISGLSREQTDARFEDIASFADIGNFMDQPVSTYSSGMYVRLAFAVQVCLDPDILVVDEALAVGDAYFVHRCFHRLRMMKEQGKTILFVSHDTPSVNNLCDRALWIHDGRLRLEGKPDLVTAHYRADLFSLPINAVSENDAEDAGGVAEPAAPIQAQQPEMSVPNIDRRIGARACRITGIGLYGNADASRISAARPGQQIVIRISIVNESLPPGTPLVVGYEIFTPRGDNLGGQNTEMADFGIEAPAIGKIFTIRAKVTLPMLHHWHYAITPAVASGTSGALTIEDRIENALVFEVLRESNIAGLMLLPTDFSLDHGGR